MPDIRKILATVGRVAASVALGRLLPGAGGLIQVAEDILGARTGPEKLSLVTALAAQILETMAKAGKLAGAAPAIEEVTRHVQQTVDAMRADGTLQQAGILATGGSTYSVVILGKLPEE